MTVVPPIIGHPSPKILIIVALLVAVFAAAIIDIVVPITTLDISKTFAVHPGTVGQFGAVNAVASVATALLLSAFGYRFRYKSLLIVGLLLIAFSALGLFLAPSFPLALLVFPLNGIGSIMIVVTAQTFIGNAYPLDKKAKAIGWVTAAGTFALTVGSPIVGYMTELGGWRSVLLWFMLPAAIVSLLFVILSFPFSSPVQLSSSEKKPFMRGFKQVFTNKSAVACLVSAFFMNFAIYGWLFFQVTFVRQVFSTSASFAALTGPLVGTAFVTTGAIIGGHTVNRVGRKRLALVTISMAGALTLLSYFIPNLWICLTIRWVASLFGGASTAAFVNLMLEQVPFFRGTAMSLSSAFSGVGHAVGIIVGGLVLDLYISPTIGFQAAALVMGASMFTAVLIILFLAKEPVKT